jgi:hypothetical protein
VIPLACSHFLLSVLSYYESAWSWRFQESCGWIRRWISFRNLEIGSQNTMKALLGKPFRGTVNDQSVNESIFRDLKINTSIKKMISEIITIFKAHGLF